MKRLYQRLTARPLIAGEMLAASLFANLLALASPLFVMQVLNRYVSQGVDATLVTLTLGVVAAILLEFAFRQARQMLAVLALGDFHEKRSLGTFGVLVTAKRAALDRVGPEERRETLRGLGTIEAAHNAANIAAIMDVPFALLFIFALFLLNPIIGTVVVLFIATVLILGLWSQKSLREPQKRMMEAAAMGHVLASTADRAADTVRVFNGQRYLMEQWNRYLAATQSLRGRVSGRLGLTQSVTQSAQALMGAAVIAIGAALVVKGHMDVGMLMGANIIAARALGPINRFAQMGDTMAKAEQALARVEALAEVAVEGEGTATPARYKGGLELRDVAFTHPGAPVPLFESLSLTLAPGSVLAVRGSNGSGKTTLARLLVGLIEPDRGQVLADGIDLRQLAPAWWRRQIVYMPQEAEFLNADILTNLRTANPDLDEGAVDVLAREAALGPFLDESAKGLATPLLDNGHTLALGVRRRLALARALATGGRLAVFDEPTEGLDQEGCAAVYRAMMALSGRGHTLVIFSHDPNILRGARLILDLDSKPTPKLLTPQEPEPAPKPTPEKKPAPRKRAPAKKTARKAKT